MAISTSYVVPRDPTYPESDGQPMADNTKQFTWIVTIQGGLDALFMDDPNVFVAGDLLWYPVQNHPEICLAPDAMVIFGRPKGDRGSYMQWQEDDRPPQVVFEVLSPKNTRREMQRKRLFYERHGVEEFYIYDPDRGRLEGWVRQGAQLQELPTVNGWTSPRLSIRFVMEAGDLRIYRPDGQRFLHFVEMQQRLEQAQQRAEHLAARLRALGIDPDEEESA